MQRLVLRRCQQGRVGLLFVVLALMRCSADDTGSAPMLATASQPQSAAGSTGEAGYPPVRAAKPLSKATGKAHRRELLLLMWRRMLRVQALNPGLRLGLTEAPAAPPLLAPKRISMLYRDEFGYEVGGIDGIAFYHELTGTLCDVLGCGQMRPIYWFASSYADAPGCKRAAGGIPHESQVWFDLEPGDNGFARLNGTAYPSAFIKSQRLGKFHVLPPDHVAPPTWEHHHALASRLAWPFPLHGQIVVIFNKHTSEWHGPPMNTLDLQASGAKLEGVVEDGQGAVVFHDKELLKGRALSASDPWHSHVFLMEDLLKGLGVAMEGFNAVQLAVLALAGCSVSVQGGPAWLAIKGGGHAVILHRRGTEARSAYQRVFPLLGMAETITVANLPPDVPGELARFVDKGLCARPSPADPHAWRLTPSLAAAWDSPPADALARIVRATRAYAEALASTPMHRYHGGDGYTMRWPPARFVATWRRQPGSTLALAPLKHGRAAPLDNYTK
mmetsp:Transcript_1055/g.2750  ORF Transcript_1055/g.2750 Transcript_1055/m.2750 type:complete len:501 (+) Transcript_1055:211-1713(+)